MKSYLCVVLALLTVHAVGPQGRGEEGVQVAYERKATWAETMLSARAAMEQAAPAAVREGTWYTTGCLPAQDFEHALFPEHSVDLQARDEQGDPCWMPQPGWQDGQVQWLLSGRRGATYLYRTLDVQQPTRWEISLGSDDGLVVWLNGQKLLSTNVARGPAPDQDRVTLSLRPGQNHLLLKIFNLTGRHGFYFQGGTPRPAVWDQIESDFPRRVRLDEAARTRQPAPGVVCGAEDVALERQMLDAALQDLGRRPRPAVA
jgi:hypothetical protein